MKFYKMLMVLCIAGIFQITSAQNVSIHGFISQGLIYSTEYDYLAKNSQEWSTELQEIGINFQKDVSKELHVGIQFLARDIGVYGNGKISIDWAYGDYFISDAFRIAVGRIKNHLGFYTDIQDLDFFRTWAILPSYFYDPGLRSINSNVDGFQLHGNIKLKELGDLNYNITYGGVKTDKTSDISAYVAQIVPIPIETVKVKSNFSANFLYNTPFNGLRLNATYYLVKDVKFTSFQQVQNSETFRNHMDFDQNTIYLGAQYYIDDFEFVCEYSRSTRNMKNYISLVSTQDPSASSKMGGSMNNDISFHGGYFGVTYRPTAFFGIGGYYQKSLQNIDISSKDPQNRGDDLAISLAFYPTDNTIVKLEGHYVEGTGLLSKALNSSFDEETWLYGVFKVSYNF